jgi:DHA1 family inner membrane transport protein
MPLPILALALTAFALGTAELAPNGILLLIGNDLGVTVAQAGWVTTAFALGAMIGGPILAAATLRLPRKPLVLALALIFLAANVVTALSSTLLAVGISRALAGVMLGGFLGTAITMASDLVAPGRRGTAIAVVFTGFTLSNVIGVPIGNVLGHSAGWQAAFWVVALLAGLGVIAMAILLPRPRTSDSEAPDGGLAVLRNGSLWIAFAAIALGYGGLFVTYTYVAPFLTEVTGFTSTSVTWVLLLFGVGLVAGNALGGRFADRSLTATVIVILTLLVVGLVALWVLGAVPAAVLPLLVVLGAAGFGMVPPLQSYVIHVAGVGSAVVSALAAASFNAGVALGSGVGGGILDATDAYELLPIVGAGMTALGLVIFLVSRRAFSRRPERTDSDRAVVGDPVPA